MYVLFLDDIRYPNDVTWVNIPKSRNTVIVRSYQEFVDKVLTDGIPDFVCFDHDLADEHYFAMNREANGEANSDYGPEKTGYDCVKWLVDYCDTHHLKFPNYVVHSMNSVGKDRMINYINNAKRHLGI